MENKIFHITDIFPINDFEHNTIGIPFKTKHMDTSFILDIKLKIKNKITRKIEFSLTLSQTFMKQPPVFKNFITCITNKEILDNH